MPFSLIPPTPLPPVPSDPSCLYLCLRGEHHLEGSISPHGFAPHHAFLLLLSLPPPYSHPRFTCQPYLAGSHLCFVTFSLSLSTPSSDCPCLPLLPPPSLPPSPSSLSRPCMLCVLSLLPSPPACALSCLPKHFLRVWHAFLGAPALILVCSV